MKKFISYITVALMLIALSGCEDFLKVQSYTTKDASSYPKSEADANELLTGVYGALNTSNSPGRGVEGSFFYTAEISSDERFGAGGADDANFQAWGHLLERTLDRFNTTWVEHYKGISRANGAMVAIESMPDGETKNQKIGEIKFLRALFYFELVQLLGNVPLLEAAPETVAEARVAPPEAEQVDIYKQIATDLWEAYQGMPAVKYDTYISGTATKWAAASLLARVYLFYTGFYGTPGQPLATLPMKEGEITKQQVIEALNDVIANSGHGLLEDFRSLWDYTSVPTRKNYPYATKSITLPSGKVLPGATLVRDGENKEHVFSIKHRPGGGDQRNGIALYFSLRQSGRTFQDVFPLGGGWGSGPVNTKTWTDWETWEPNDMRRVASIYQADNVEEDVLRADGITPAGDYVWGAENQMEETGYWQKKYVYTMAHGGKSIEGVLWRNWYSCPVADGGYGVAGDSESNSNGKDLILIRYADVLLMHSELTETATGINTVRTRVGLPDVAYSTNALRNERRFELAFEGLRWGDIRRWHIAEQVLPNKYGVEITNIKVKTTMKPQSRGGIAERYRKTKGFFPKPDTQMQLAPDGLTQNPGWSSTDDAGYNTWDDSGQYGLN